MGRLDGKVALISGTARGMGRAAAVEFAAQGAAVFGCDLDEKANAETVELVTATGGRMAAIAPVDLATADGARAGSRRPSPSSAASTSSTTTPPRCATAR